MLSKLIPLFLLTSTIVFSQFSLDAEIRPRFEYRHGFKTLFPDNADPSAFVSQRTRLNAGYKASKYRIYISLQDYRVWGDVKQLNTEDKHGVGLHQAYGELLFNEKLSLKLGRQVISLDDERIFGEVGWAQQARSHDAAVLKYANNNLKLNVGGAFNQGEEDIESSQLTTEGTYKSMQYLWLHNDWENFSGSFLFLNNGTQYTEEVDPGAKTRYSQTAGVHLTYKKDKLNLLSNLYYQFGKDISNADISAYLLALELNYKATSKINAGVGAEITSGNENGVVNNNENNAFNPFYGTNHKFNGLMDYFYVGNHIDNVGLVDIYIKSNINIGEKSKLNVFVHNFSAAAELNDGVKKQLGTEVDLTYNYTFSRDVKIGAGYSHMFPSEGMEFLKGNTDGNTNNWAWLMITFKPKLIK